MLQRSKYSRLRNDSLSSLEERPPQGAPPTKADPGLTSDPARVSPPATSRTPGRTLSALEQTPRPITLRRTVSQPWTPRSQGESLASCLTVACSGTDGRALGGRESRAVHRHIKYMGSLEVTQSMRALDFDTRMQVTREAISRLCEKTPGTKTALKSRRTPCKGLLAVLGQSNLQFCGTSVLLTISTDSVVLTSVPRLQTIAHHPMQSISFASGGDPDMADYVAYVAKDHINQRACHILECSPGRACEVINSIGRAFETRFQKLLSHAPSLLPTNHKSAVRVGSWCTERTEDQEDEQLSHHDHDYYNEVPGKAPPPGGVKDMRFSDDSTDAAIQRVCSSQAVSQYENCSLSEETPSPSTECVSPEPSGAVRSQPLIQNLLQEEIWFHGRLGRSQAETLLSCSGDFLVRESSSAPEQYVLSGMEGSTVRHLLLVDPQGQVRTRDQVFHSVSHLVRFHLENQAPIVSGSSELRLKNPVRQTF